MKGQAKTPVVMEPVSSGRGGPFTINNTAGEENKAHKEGPEEVLCQMAGVGGVRGRWPLISDINTVREQTIPTRGEGKGLPGKRIASAKALRLQPICGVQGTSRKPVWQE